MFDASAPFALFDDNLDRRGDLLLSDLDAHVVAHTPDDVAEAFRAISAAQTRGQWVALAAAYELGYALEPKLAGCFGDRGGPLLEAWVFRRATPLTDAETSAALEHALGRLGEHERVAGIASVVPAVSKSRHLGAVERIRSLIAAGDCYQVNYTFPMRGELHGDPLALYRRLRFAQPVRHGAFIRDAHRSILSRSPELFVERRGTRVTCRPMKGTAARGASPDELASSEKNRAENVMIVDLLRNDLSRLAPAGCVEVTRLCEIEAYPTVWQMTSTIVAEPVVADLETVFRALFPCGSVTGAPKIRAMQIVRELELEARGLYCGALGWISPDGDFRFSVPIRTAVTDGDRGIRIGVGSGIVADSDGDDEWAECLLKSRFITGLGPAFGLVETLRCEPDTPERYPLLELHLDRLGASAHHFGVPFGRGAVRDALLDAAAGLRGLHRVRLQLDPSGRFEIASAPLDAASPPRTPSAVVSPHRIGSGDPLRRFKTTVRELYDAELARVTAAGHFDALFLNERGELAEGARTNVFVDLGDGVLLTPPLASGALDGVYRRKLLAEGRARERRLDLRDLLRAREIQLANAVRGLVRVELADSGPTA